MMPGKSLISLLFCCLLFTACKHVEERRFMADVRINDKPVKMAYDTGSDTTLVFNKTVKRVGAKIVEPPNPGKAPAGKVNLGETGFCEVKLGSDTYKFKLATLRLPGWWRLNVDGVIGWPDMKDDLIAIDATAGTINGLTRLPDDAANWVKLPLYSGTGVLALEIPHPDGKSGVLEVDTGNFAGVSLAPERWREWKAAHPHAHSSYSLHAMPGAGVVIGRKYVADQLAIGPLVLTNVTVREANRTEVGIVGNSRVYEGSIGFQALERLNFIVDQKNRVAYVQPRPVLDTNNAPAKMARLSAVSTNHSTVHLRFREHELLDRAKDEFKSANYDDAARDYAEFLQLEPGNAWGHALYGEARYHVGATLGSTNHYEQAVKELSRALELDPGIATAWFIRGNARYLAGQWDDAVKDYERFCQLDPDDGSYPRFYIWLIRARAGDRAAADKELETYYGPAGRKAGGPWQAKIAAFLLGQVSEADFLRIAEHDPESQCEAWYYAGMRRRLSGDRTGARDYFQKCIATAQTDFYEYGFAAAELKAMN